MAIRFRTSLFGFKKRDVIEYIELANKSTGERESKLMWEASSLRKEIATLQEDIVALKSEKDRLENIQAEYIRRYNEVEKMSEDIGKLYLTAQTNAKEITEQSLKERELINKEVEANINAIEEMHSSLDIVKNEILNSVGNFSGELEKLFEAFNAAKAKLKDNGFEE